MRHLSTEELLLHGDGALAPELAAHVEECPGCRDAWLNLQAVLCEAEEVIRSSVPPEPPDRKVASRLALERALYPPKTSAGFPLRWSVVYSVAAALTLTVLSGYLSTRQRSPQVREPELASVAQSPAPTEIDGSRVAATSPQLSAASAVALLQPETNGELFVAPLDNLVAATENVVAEPAQAVLASAAPLSETETAAGEVSLARFDLAVTAEQQLAPRQVAWIEPPSVSAAPGATLAALRMPAPPVPTFRTSVEEIAVVERDMRGASDPLAFASVVEGYWALTQGNVWEEDVRPVWTDGGLRMWGTVEDAAVRQRVESAVLGHTSQPAAFDLRLRGDLPAGQEAGRRRTPRVVHAVYSGPAGGTVRRSLLGHFGDAARRSFVAPQPSALEGELVRYVSEVYRNQSELLSHAYALQRFLGELDAANLASAAPQTARRFHNVVDFHLRALDEREAAIYDRLSEALPRKIWSHRSDANEAAQAVGWREESEGLLQEALELDSNLTALFGSSSLTVDASNPDQSCGELLDRIRTRIRRIKNRTQAL